MNLLFVVPKAYDVASISPGICYVATATQNADHRTFGLNLNNTTSDHKSALSSAIIKHDIDGVFIGGTSGDFDEVSRIATISKRIKSEILVVVGGYLVSTEPELVISNINADYGVIGPGETTSVELLEVLRQKKSKKLLNEISGLIYIDETSELVKTKQRELRSFDFTRIPDLSLLFDDDIKENKHICLVGSIGCPYNCTFCSRPVGTKKYVQRSLDSLFNELDHWLNLYDIENININDELFASNQERILAFCARIHDYKIGFSFQGRVDAMNEELLAELKKAGCQSISYGLESANNEILKSMKKGTTIEQIEKALSATRKCGISIVGNFIFGDIRETYETANDTLNWWSSKGSDYDIYLTMIQPLPGSHVYEYAIRKGIIKDRLQFLKEGCPPVNFSMMTDDEMLRLKRKIDNLLHLKSKAYNVSIKAVNVDNSLDLMVECGHCFNEFEVYARTLRVDSRWAFERCPHCGGHNLLSPNDIYKPFLYKQMVDDISESYFKNFALNKKTIAIWGAKERGQLLILSSPSLRKCLVKIVDSAYQNYKTKVFGIYEVENPESLKKSSVDCLIIASTNYKEEIRSIVLDDFKLDIEVLDI
ncbi:MAG: B12-binding domain-containing radical SAM protein [Desulfatitalea sp.]|nr:B12-binding domain-containing radical SAM protein [Desulfatitalea sp.]